MFELDWGQLLWIFTAACVVNNFTLSYFLGLCPFLGVSGRIDTAVRMGMATIFVMTVTSICAWLLNTFILPHAPYLRLICFIVVIASAVQFVEMTIKKLSPALFKALGIYLPLITTNCAILGLALFISLRSYSFIEGLVFGVGAGVGFTLALLIMAGIREELETADIPEPLKGAGITLILAGILSLAFMGFAGLI